MTTNNIAFLREFSILGLSDDTIKNKIQLSKKIHQNFYKMEAPCFSYGEEIL